MQTTTIAMENGNDKTKYVGYWVRRLLKEYLPCVRNLSKCTILSYRDAIKLLVNYASKKCRCTTDELQIEQITPGLIKDFLMWIETDRGCSIKTRNLRLAGIYALADYASSVAPELIEWCRLVHSVPTKKPMKPTIPYLEKHEMDALLAAPDRKTEQGERDYIILAFLYNTGARVEEAASLKIMDLSLPDRKNKGVPMVTIVGKGNKTRRCPLWDNTAKLLKGLVSGRDESEYVFINRYGNRLTRFGIYELVRKYAKAIMVECPTIKNKRLSPHTIRHTTASHLLQAGVDINTIRAWLGHVSINTTNIYAEVNLEMKAQALACCAMPEDRGPKKKKKGSKWSDDKDLMSFLDSL